jgi:hypothetical protein
VTGVLIVDSWLWAWQILFLLARFALWLLIVVPLLALLLECALASTLSRRWLGEPKRPIMMLLCACGVLNMAVNVPSLTWAFSEPFVSLGSPRPKRRIRQGLGKAGSAINWIDWDVEGPDFE